jgi:phage terminase large subunit-like protein
MDSQKLEEVYAYVMAAKEREQYNRWLFYEPYPKQQLFMELGATYKERLLTAGNQVGKSDCGGYETSCHVTGIYPPWWKGLRFDQNTGPCDSWVGGTSGEAVRDGAQFKLFGPPGISEMFGTGFIPKDKILGDPTHSRSASDALDTAHIRHSSGGVSTLGFKTYKQERTDWQGPTKKWIWFDEEPPIHIYTEGLARLAATGGSHILTFTPLLGFSDVVRRFLECPEKFRHLRVHVQMGLNDAAHMTPELQAQTLSSYPESQWKARRDGDPYLSGGLIFSTAPEDLMEDPYAMGLGLPGLRLPGEWPKLWAIDLLHSGGDNSDNSSAHAFAAVLMAFDREFDLANRLEAVHIIAGFKTRAGLPTLHADRIKSIAANVPVAWPHDGNIRDMKGEEIKTIYKNLGLNMLGEHATFPQGGYSTEAGILDMEQAMTTGRWRVNKNLQDWFQEYRLYHRDEKGMIVKVNDDLLSASRIGWMMRRYAKNVPLGSKVILPPRLNIAPRIDPFTGQAVR